MDNQEIKEKVKNEGLSFRQQIALDIYKGLVLRGDASPYSSIAWQAFNAADAFIQYLVKDEQKEQK
jgi:hypothetical protein